MPRLNLTKRFVINVCLFVAALLCAPHLVSAQIRIGGINVGKSKHAGTPDPNQPNKSDSGTSGGNSTGADGDAQTNPHAPADYNANLNVGDQAIAVNRFGNLEVVKVVGKSGTAYRVVGREQPNSPQLYSVNSVYPYFDTRAFSEMMYEYKHFVTPYLQCYGNKHNLEETRVTTEGYHAFGARHFNNANDAQRTLGAEQPKLAELDAQLKTKLGSAQPNTFLEFMSNPAIVAEIAAQRTEYLKCAVGVEDSKPDVRLSVFMEDLKKAQSEAERYSPAEFLYLVSAGGPDEQLLYAVSHRAREEWAGKWLKNPASRSEFDAEWDKLATIAAKKIPTYKPSPESYRFHYPAGEKLLMGSIKNLSGLKIFRIGTDVAGWEIQKDNDNFLPTYRYKTMKVYYRDPNDDHQYCHVVSARIKQDYAGGGTYNAQVYSSSTSQEIFGCP